MLDRKVVHIILIVFAAWSVGISSFAQGPIKIEKLSSRINSALYDETNPLVSRDGKYLYFTRVGHPGFDRTLYQEGKDVTSFLSSTDYDDLLREVYTEITEDPNHDPLTSPFNQDIWIAVSVEGEFDALDHPGYPANSALPNSICSLTPSDDQFVVVNEFYQDGSMYKGFSLLTRYPDGTWSHPRPMHIYEMTEYSPEVNLNLSNDGEIALISMLRSDGIGKNDLYASFRLSEQKWSAPVNLGPQINSPYRDITPYLASDNRTLYFASDRPGGYGGLDIYVSLRIGDGWDNWSEPKPVPSPINSPFDDGQPFLHEASGQLYFASIREGDSNLYRTEEASLLDYLDIDLNREPQEEDQQVVADIAPKVEAAPTPKEKTAKPITVNCQLFNSMTGQPIDGTVSFGLLAEEKPVSTMRTQKGAVDFQLVARDFVKIRPNREGFIGHDKIINPAQISAKGENVINLTFFLDPLQVDALIGLKPIYFERSKAIVLDQSFMELDRLADILSAHDYIGVEISGHTDHIGEKSLLYELSSDRARAIKSYLVKKGIAPNRLSTVGHGPDYLISDKTDEQSRSLNRRVEVKITKIQKDLHE